MQKLASLTIALLLCGAVPAMAQPLSPIAQVDARKTQAEAKLKEATTLLGYSNWLAAQQPARSAVDLYRAIGDRNGQVQALTLLTQALYQQGQFQLALQAITQAEGLTETAQQRGQLVSLRGLIALDVGNYREALQSFQRAQGSQLRDIAQENRNRIGLGEAYRYLGMYRNAQNMLNLAVRTSGHRPDYGRALNALGDVHFDLGQYAEAQDFYQQALQVRRSLGDRRAILRTLNNLGRVQRELGNWSAAMKFHQDALGIATGLGDNTIRANILNNLAIVQMNLGQLKSARDLLEQATGFNRMVGNSLDVTTLINFAQYYIKAGQLDQAAKTYQLAIDVSRRKGDRLGEARALSGLGQLRLKSGDAKAAIPVLQNSIELFELLRPGLRDDEKVSMFESQAETYRLLQQAWVTQGDPAMALTITERGRARAFVELLAKRLVQSDETRTALKSPNFAEIQATAQQNRATLVSYSIIQNDRKQDSELYIWVVNPDGKLTFRRVDLQALNANTSLDKIAQGARIATATGQDKQRHIVNNLVIAMRGTITGPSPVTSNGLLASPRNAYEVLIQPIADLLPTDPNARVIFIPQDSLLLVPFQALQDATGKFLIEKHTLLMAPSIQALSLIKKYEQNQTSNALVIGNPSPMPEPLVPLPGAETEAKTIAQILNTQALIGAQAKESTVLQKIPQARIIHLATHGLLDDQQGLQSSLAFAPSENNNGLLTAEEILNLKLNANLAVLSACDTGRGKITGDGVIGLSRSLLSAGVSSVVVSLWAVPDLPTATLMTEFYRNLQTNPDKAQALRQAMLTTMSQNPSPRDWAGFMLIGSAD
jgi:CHAT domain-containing protein/tetratricopeptide (TPR) repeat protein